MLLLTVLFSAPHYGYARGIGNQQAGAVLSGQATQFVGGGDRHHVQVLDQRRIEAAEQVNLVPPQGPGKLGRG